jgi:hypothetical protein
VFINCDTCFRRKSPKELETNPKKGKLEMDELAATKKSELLFEKNAEKPEVNQEKNKNARITYTHDEAFQESLKYFKGDELAAKVWVNKYALKDSYGALYEKSPDDMHHRIANEIARIEAKYANPISAREIYELLQDFKYIVPQGSPMTGHRQ